MRGLCYWMFLVFHVVLGRMPIHPTKSIMITSADNTKKLKEAILTYTDLGFNLIIIGYGRHQRPSYGALPVWLEMEALDQTAIKRYMASKDAFLLYALGGPKQQIESEIRNSQGYNFGNQNIAEANANYFDGFYLDLYFRPDNYCLSILQTDNCVSISEPCHKKDPTDTCLQIRCKWI